MILSYISPVLMECLYDFVVHINKLPAIYENTRITNHNPDS